MTRLYHTTVKLLMKSFETKIVNEINNAYDKNEDIIMNSDTAHVPVRAHTKKSQTSRHNS